MSAYTKSNQKKLEEAARLHVTGDLAGAEKLYRKVLTTEPTNPKAHELLGKLHLQRNEWQKADHHLGRFLEAQPDDAESNGLRGYVLAHLHRPEESSRLILKSLRKNPNNPPILAFLGQVLNSAISAPNNPMSYDRYIDNLQEVARITGYGTNWVFDTTQAMCNIGDIDRAQKLLQEAAEHRPSDLWPLREAMLLHPIMLSMDDIDEMRQRFESRLDDLLARGVHYKDTDPIPIMTFYLAFHGKNNRTIMEKLGRLIGSQPFLQYSAPHVTKKFDPAKKLKVGFCSAHLISRHSVANAFWALIKELADTGRIEVVTFPLYDDSIEKHKQLADDNIKTVLLKPDNWGGARDAIAREELDVLVYPDIGMNSFTYLLAYTRLAPVQCVMSGHPDTTGIPTMDYYISGEHLEPPNAQEHYTEKLIRTKHAIFHAARHNTIPSERTRRDFGLPEDRILYFCPMMLQKIHPEFDHLLAKLLDADPSGDIVFPEDNLMQGVWANLLKERFSKSFTPEMQARIHFVPWQTRREDFLALLHSTDALLDPTYFGGGTTCLIATEVGIPFVTWPGEFCRGRVVASIYHYIGVEDTIAENEAEYITKAMRLAHEPEWRHAIGMKMKENDHLLFENRQSVSELTEILFALRCEADNRPPKILA